MKNWVYQMLIKIFSFCCPIKKKKILLFSYYGNQYGCSPKYMSEYLANNTDYDLVWAFTQPQKYSLAGVRNVRYYSLQFFYELCTAHVIITNYRMIELFQKRKGQVYIQTWHSSLRLKMIEKDAEDKLPAHYVKMAKKDSQYIDCLISGCSFSTQIFRSSFWYSGFILECGTPRNDLFFTQVTHISDKIKDKYAIPARHKLLLYAPTFRQGGQVDCYNLNYTRLKSVLSQRWGGDWTILVRFHPHLRPIAQQLIGNEPVVDVTSYDDIQELLAASDVLISDYSSLVFDYILTGRPCFLYVPDLNLYMQKERGLYFKPKDLPFEKALSNEELFTSISNFSEEAYSRRVKIFQESIGSYEKGTACQQIGRYIREQMNK